ncbi:MAG: DUF4411 family protein [Bacteroidales bacterium]|nr:DUF4411 family protein [Bacteroidales bacterium]MCF8328117.1 DUF4411 family protein [Bacteroidales bacterium]
MSVYVVDTNFFIQAHRVHYPLDVVSSFWNKVKELAGNDFIISIDKVKHEIYRNNDTLKQWCENNLPDDFFKDTSNITSSYSQVVSWAMAKRNHFLPNALNEFLDSETADAFIVAYVLFENHDRVVVTQEISEPNSKKKVKIPDVCIGLNVRYVNVIDMFRELGETF